MFYTLALRMEVKRRRGCPNSHVNFITSLTFLNFANSYRGCVIASGGILGSLRRRLLRLRYGGTHFLLVTSGYSITCDERVFSSSIKKISVLLKCIHLTILLRSSILITSSFIMITCCLHWSECNHDFVPRHDKFNCTLMTLLCLFSFSQVTFGFE